MAGSRPSGSFAQPSAPAFDVGVGAHLGKYEIVKKLATGGMAEIFLARVSGLPGFHKLVVIKRILPQLATQTDFVEMFLDEARIAATLQHPNVVQMYDVGVVERNYFIAMEYLHGEDVRAIGRALKERERRMPIEHALNIVLGVAAGLHYAHEKVGLDGRPLQIVHRDVTPQNVVVTYDGAVKLLDFGIAKASNRFGETRFGTLKGKVPYMSPEQCRAEPLDRRSDIFSLGIMLYEITLGRRLYHGNSDFEMLKQIVEAPVPPPRSIDPAYPPELEAIVLRALAKDKEERYQTARELQVDLEALVRADRLHVSPIALTAFMEELFEPEIGAWRKAQARGLSLDKHLTTVQARPASPDDDDDLLSLELTEAGRAELARERAEFKARIDAQAVVTVVTVVAARPDATPDDPTTRMTTPPGEEEPLTASTAVTELPGWRPPRWLMWSLAVPAAVVAAALVAREWSAASLRERSAASRATAAGAAAAPPQPAGASEARARSATDRSDEPPAAITAVRPAPAAAPATNDATTRRASSSSSGKHAGAAAATRAKPAAAARPPAALRGEGTLLLASSPWCNVRIDGVDKGPTPLDLKLRAGRHTVLLSNPEFKITRTITVAIEPNETLRKRLDFDQ